MATGKDDVCKPAITQGTAKQGAQDVPVYYEPTSSTYPEGTSPGLGKDYGNKASKITNGEAIEGVKQAGF
jgi:hypothetical protein